MQSKKETPKPMCGAKLRGKDQTCRRLPMKGRKKCKLHGGASLTGSASATWKHGRFSKYLPTGLRQRYVEYCRDPQSNDLRDDIALLDVNISELLVQAQERKAIDVLPRLKKLIPELSKAVDEGDKARGHEVVALMERALKEQAQIAGVWDKIVERIEVRRKLVETQMKRALMLGSSISVGEAQEFMASMCLIIKTVCEQNINDRTLAQAILRQINAQFQANFAEPGPATPGSNTVH